ncbi:hypothetical protein [Slackia isoflavoniconvertens]|uniref:hypothetical protein n=1 Tax=Slackia isoflavoniconvertens TaxID=572010 RepID=UPI003F9BE387
MTALEAGSDLSISEHGRKKPLELFFHFGIGKHLLFAEAHIGLFRHLPFALRLGNVTAPFRAVLLPALQ